MKKFLAATVSGLALLGLAACSEGDNTTTQSIESEQQDTTPMDAPAAAPEAPDTMQDQGTTSQ
ncbi:hypothetical protein JYP46_11375 [Nitratireductor aquimarinus]|uniref:hypothetical protein n=1 Tax=Alphaproteobacteria TaxID=28211 RepID=UPI0019D3D17E|nr:MULTISPECIES: hypothetical protein [Alphaproteobacteria]MBY6022207.1 hypothetical protein [Nitratireductor sp. DP7N14-4]MBN7757418.1 hypothetical protein [Nitratireductor aquimarinus]MBY6000178.1 hypothetical protein [Tritonibacter mobilis]MCV0380057.1 hypothetical protein [Nitratireductor sp.]MDV2964516.1 hypothetical protein [Nitratireductor aquimarinus]